VPPNRSTDGAIDGHGVLFPSNANIDACIACLTILFDMLHKERAVAVHFGQINLARQSQEPKFDLQLQEVNAIGFLWGTPAFWLSEDASSLHHLCRWIASASLPTWKKVHEKS